MSTKKPKAPRAVINKQEIKAVEDTERLTEHKPFKLSALPKIDNTGLPSSFSLLWSTIKDIYKYRWRNFFFILSYGLPWYLFTYTDSNSTVSAIFSIIIGVIATLASIWLIRHREAAEKPTIRWAYYRGMVQLIPFMLVGTVLVLQLMPGYIGFALFDTAVNSGSFVTPLEQSVPLLIWVFLACLSFYWSTATLMSLYVVTIPGTLPIQALKAGKKLVDGRRWFIFRRMLIGSAAIVLFYLPFAYWFASQEWRLALERLSIIYPIVLVPFVHTYFFKLYNSLIQKK